MRVRIDTEFSEIIIEKATSEEIAALAKQYPEFTFRSYENKVDFNPFKITQTPPFNPGQKITY